MTILFFMFAETCVFNGKSYTQGQQWYDGCDRTCVCEDAHMGYYRCDDRCAKFPNLPNTCTLTADPKDPQCCKVPQCIPIPGVNGNTINPSAQPIIVTGVPGVITGVGGTPVPHPYCIYKGQAYHQGQKWQDGCDYNCECVDGKMGKYQCTQRCSTFPVIPPQCQLQRDTKDYCCFVPHCDFNQTVPTSAPQFSPVPGASNIPSTAFCVYNGLPFKQGQVWEEGCSKQCRCDNAVTNYYSCFDRCPSFSNLDPSCIMKTNPNDPCCQIPECLNSPTLAPNMQPTLMPGATPNPNPYPVPTLPPGKITGSGPQVNPNTGLPQIVGFCEYKGVQYHKGDTWDDGCNYKCKCIEESTGTFTCNERCPRFAKLPANCFMATDPKDTCCKIPSCPPTAAPGLSPTPAPGHTLSPTQMCIYQGHPYTQGQKWFDGCDKKCTCENAKIGYYSCSDRCPSYTNLTPTCIMVPDPNDPDCCTAPQCDNTNTTNPTGVYGSIEGSGRPPTLTEVCVYKGTQYTQGQKWQDGCSYNCECMNADAGRFICTDRCARYPNLPLSCRLEFDPMDPCCEKPNCSPNPAPTLRPGQTTPSPNDFCVYNGIPYKQGQTWQVGCKEVCRCDDAKTGRINCDDRCPSFPVLTSTCSLVTDPNDDCCQVPKCVNTNTTNPDQVIIGVPGTITNGGHGTLPIPNSGTRNGCVYKGKYYTQGQQWDDGCAYHCSCDDGSSGLYRCTEKCPRYAQIPSYCTMIQDPANQCCEKPYCTPLKTPSPQPSLAPGQTPPTVSPLSPPQLNSGCNYNGQMFKQGQLWYDGCSKICLCENGATNFYRCQDRCAKFNTIGAGCTMVPDSRDPACCKVPSCPLVTPSVTPTPGIYTPVPSPPGVITGYGKVPTLAPKPTPSPQPGVSTLAPVAVTPVPGCLYKGQIYGKGIKWDDGCNYKCECLDDMTGRYQCSQRCQRYNNIPKDKCVLIEDPNDKCCEVPYCDFLNPTPFPNGAPTPQPIMAPSPNPGVSPTPKPNVQPTLGPNGATPVNPFLVPVYYPTKSPSITPSPNGTNPGLIPQQKGFCEYKGVYYTQGQTWTDGCQKVCRCEAPERGYFQCSSRCPRYSNLSSSCVLKTNPADPCCLAPDCNQYPTPRPDLPPVPGASPTTPIPIYVPSAVTGSFVGSAQTPSGITGGGINFCVYKGKVYGQGMTWDDGCNYKCTCEDASRGLYKCNDKCPQYYQLPWQCHYEKDPKDSCCQIAKCDFNLSPTPAPSTPAPITMAPTPHGWTGPTVKPLDVCLYIDNTTYSKGQTWDVGCDFHCVCVDPSQNKFSCSARCQVFASLPSVCSLVPDPSDKCCEKVSCGSYTPVTVINGTATPPPNSLNVLPVGTHDVFAGSSWGPGSGTHPVTGKRDKCIYNGQAYSQGQSWNDGCQYVCTCEDAEKGVYRCLSKCPAYPQVPSYCHKVTVPGQCCPSLSCDVPGFGNYNPVPQLVPVVAPTPQPGVSPTPRPSGLPPVIHVVPSTSLGNTTGGFAPLPGGGYPINNNQISGVTSQCIYKNKLYNQGEKWDDDCDYTCECIDGRTGYYECKPKCPAYPDLPATCFLIKASGSCCRVPQCTYYGMVVDPVAHPDIGIPVVGQYSGGFTGFKPGINFTQTFPSFSNLRNVCVYKGVTYKQNDKWDDGCDFSCICDDASTGHYQCNTKCPTFAKLPSYCTLVSQPGDCCKKVQCDPGLLLISTTTPVTLTPTPYPPTPTPDPKGPHCSDAIDNCATYGRNACSQYDSWAMRNCQAYCGLCSVSTITPCRDQLPNCHEFGYSQCSGIYTVWAKDNCADYCGLCPGATHFPTTTVTTTTGLPCVDVLPNCQDFVAANFCSDPAYRNWSLTNCAYTCGLCNGNAHGPTSTVGSMTTGNGWLLLMKGVAGVPGNLYQLWSGTATLNPNVPEASYLTAQYPGHYKPDYSNNWGSLCLDQVKVSIYNKGVEKAWIVFNATGADKMNWYTKDRIIDSSWSDIKTAASQFSMAGDPTFGRQFYASGNSNGCDSSGWMMISTTTTNPCFFESGSKPAFYYAPGQTQARWGFTKGTGDVFAIQGHSTCPTTLVMPTNSGSRNGCTYKGQTYKAGDNWVDDCKYNCTCDSDVTGHYTCNDL
ncbi:kielin/chordin-like protein [Ylistrum balloti]|uniref:kielin/chordin-like protein n=1 Tax=Ylistrum balloti TaxID=509963 RepID=UPI002905D9F5|nr:kielin/chordin-like protein [Ylistrum balloti]